MTISWKVQAERAVAEAARRRAVAEALPMRTHARKEAFMSARHMEREAVEFGNLAGDQ